MILSNYKLTETEENAKHENCSCVHICICQFEDFQNWNIRFSPPEFTICIMQSSRYSVNSSRDIVILYITRYFNTHLIRIL